MVWVTILKNTYFLRPVHNEVAAFSLVGEKAILCLFMTEQLAYNLQNVLGNLINVWTSSITPA